MDSESKDSYLDGLTLDKKHLKNVAENLKYNDWILKHYRRFYMEEDRSETIQRKIESLSYCNSYWLLDKYERAKIKDFQRTNLCRDKFCNNCKKVKQAQRMAKFIPLIRPYKQNLYQITLTIPNVTGDELESSIKTLFKGFAQLVGYLKGKNKIGRNLFGSLDYEGAIRSLEVTYKGGQYHPHLHAILVLNSDLSERAHTNTYSVDRTGKRAERKFTDEEILIQKVWYLIINKIKVVQDNLDNFEKVAETNDGHRKHINGYSCTLDKFQEDDFVELFKYMTKGTTEKYDEEDDSKPMNYHQFKTLYYALHSKRQIQGYGCFFNLKDVEELSKEDLELEYQKELERLTDKEEPSKVYETPEDLAKDEIYRIISRAKFHNYLKKIRQEESNS